MKAIKDSFFLTFIRVSDDASMIWSVTSSSDDVLILHSVTKSKEDFVLEFNPVLGDTFLLNDLLKDRALFTGSVILLTTPTSLLDQEKLLRNSQQFLGECKMAQGVPATLVALYRPNTDGYTYRALINVAKIRTHFPVRIVWYKQVLVNAAITPVATKSLVGVSAESLDLDINQSSYDPSIKAIVFFQDGTMTTVSAGGSGPIYPYGY